jgi:hypothetical protein
MFHFLGLCCRFFPFSRQVYRYHSSHSYGWIHPFSFGFAAGSFMCALHCVFAELLAQAENHKMFAVNGEKATPTS